jgi:dihydroxyacetone kinase-like protein
MKKFLDDPENAVRDTLAGLAAAHPDRLRVDPELRLVTRAGEPRSGKVGLVSGGGSGHEPLHAGYVGTGMLDAACPGEVFTSPVPDQILAATKAADTGAGVVHIVKNYTGDVLNFQLAAELAADENIRVETVLVDDDVAVEDSTFTAGRRGTGATVFVEKLTGALAERGDDIDAVTALGRRVVASSRSFAVALTAATTPASGEPGFELAADEIEIGVGIHGEPGRESGKHRSASELAQLMTDAVLRELPSVSGSATIVMVNGMGGTPLMELYLLYGRIAPLLEKRGVTIARNLVGNYITSLDMAGASLTVCLADPELLDLWDAPVDTPALRWGV